MKKYEAKSIEDACIAASRDLGCLIEELDYNILQYPSKGIFGLFAKNAVIEARKIEKDTKEEEPQEIKTQEQSHIEDSFESASSTLESEKIVDSFFSETSKKETKPKFEKIDAKSLENKIKELFSHSCFDIDTIEVDIENNTAYVFIDGKDAALLIGKEGYRYNAISYLLFNWINSKYGLYLKLEIAQFLASQQEMIKHLMQPVIEHVKKEGWGKTKELNGILVQIALEYLRDVFPNKYVAIKKNQNGERYNVINEFNKR
jgi:spoIIIJ-associated protein